MVNGKTRPQPPVQRMTACAVIASTLPDHQLDRDDALHPAVVDQQLASRTTRRSGRRSVYFSEVWNSVWSMWKPVLSAANHVRIFFMPPNGRTAMRPSGSRLHGQPQCSSRSSSSRRFLDERLDGVLVAQPVAAGDGVVGVLVEAVVGADDAGGAALGRDGVAAHRIDLGDDGDAESGFVSAMAMAARSPAPPPPTRRTSWERVTAGASYSAERSSSTRMAPSWRTTFRLTLPSWYSWRMLRQPHA